MEISVDSKAIFAYFKHLEGRIQKLPRALGPRLDSIIRDGLRDGHTALRFGGSVNLADGSSLVWTKVRNRMTERIRESRGLGRRYPLLFFTGTLQSALFEGRTVVSGNSVSYLPKGSIPLIRTHQYGGPPLPSRKAKLIQSRYPRFSIPARPVLFWSHSMAREVQTLTAAALKRR